MKSYYYGRMRRRLLPVLTTLGVTAAMLVALAPAVSAVTYTVTTLNDANSGSLREAILDANASDGADVITFQAGLTGKISLASRLPNIDSAGGDLTIQGPGANHLTISGNNSVQVMLVESGTSLTLTAKGAQSRLALLAKLRRHSPSRTPPSWGTAPRQAAES